MLRLRGKQKGLNERGGNEIQRSLCGTSEGERERDKHGSAKDCHRKGVEEGATEKSVRHF